MQTRAPRVHILSRRHRQTYHRRIRVFHAEPRAPIEIPPPSQLPWADAISRVYVAGGRLFVEFGS